MTSKLKTAVKLGALSTYLFAGILLITGFAHAAMYGNYQNNNYNNNGYNNNNYSNNYNNGYNNNNNYNNQRYVQNYPVYPNANYVNLQTFQQYENSQRTTRR